MKAVGEAQGARARQLVICVTKPVDAMVWRSAIFRPPQTRGRDAGSRFRAFLIMPGVKVSSETHRLVLAAWRNEVPSGLFVGAGSPFPTDQDWVVDPGADRRDRPATRWAAARSRTDEDRLPLLRARDSALMMAESS